MKLFSKIRFRMFIPDPGSSISIFSIPDPGVKKAADPESGSATQLFYGTAVISVEGSLKKVTKFFTV
jgi:hypothetical protein